MDEKYEDKNSRVLEGVYRGLINKIDEMHGALDKEFQFGSTQQTCSYEALTADFKNGIDKILSELKYLAQQNSAIYDFARKEREDLRDSIIKEMIARDERLLSALEARLSAPAAAQSAHAPAPEIDYDLLAGKVAALLAPQSPVNPVLSEETEEDRPVLQTEEGQPVLQTEEGRPVLQTEEGQPAVETVSTARTEAAQAKSAASPVMHEFDDSNFAYEILAEKIATIMPELDYDLIVDKVVAALPQFDAELIAEHVVANIPQPNEDAIAEAVIETIPLTDYDLIAEKVVAALEEKDAEIDDEAVEKIAQRVVELLRADEVDLDRIVSELEPEDTVSDLSEDTVIGEVAAADVPAPVVASAPAPTPSVTSASTPAPTPVVSAPAPVVPVVIPVSEEEEQDEVPAALAEDKMLRYKRSFVAKIIGSEEEVKEYYSDLKNAILAYGKVRSQVNWTNDRFFIGNDSIIKIGMRGKTLCLYLALNPDEFPETVYHQKFAGDTKMYELTPMMVKIKSKAAVKKGIRLIDLLMERNGAIKESREEVDYAAQYFFRTDDELLAEGLIKTAIVDKSDLDF